LYYFTVGVGLENLVEKVRFKMKQDFQKHIPVGFIIQPVVHNEPPRPEG
jgi:hypothetical protein